MEAAERVLVDAALLPLIASFQAGLPGRLYSYWRTHRCAWRAQQDDEDRDGELPAIAVFRRDLGTLSELHALFLSSSYYREMPLLHFDDVISQAASLGAVESLQWLHGDDERRREGVKCEAIAAHTAATGGHSAALQWLLENCPLCSAQVSINTAKVTATNGHLEAVRVLSALRPELFSMNDVMTAAAECGQLEIVQFLHEDVAFTDRPRYCKNAMNKAASAGQLSVVEYLHRSCAERCTTEALDWAAANGHLEVVRFLHSERTEGCTVYAMDQAAAQGHLEVVKFLHENRHEGCTIYAMSAAARRGHLAVVEFLHENRSEGCSSWALAEASEKGYLDVVQFLHANKKGMDWEDSALFRAARNGHLAVVEFLCENTKVGDRVFDARRGAKSFARDDVVKYLDKQIQRLLDQKESEQREKLRRRKHAKAKKKRK